MKDNLPPELNEIEALREIQLDEIRLSGVYFLCKNDEILYVGQSVNLYGRLSTHNVMSGHNIDKVYFIPVENTEIYKENSYRRAYTKLDVVESKFIHKLRPSGNGRQTLSYKAKMNKEKRKMRAPMNEELLAELGEINND